MNVLVRARISGDDSQRTFDALLGAAAEPGTVRQLPPELLTPEIPTPLWLTLALADVDVPISVADDTSHPLATLAADATGAPIVPLEQAWVAVLLAPSVEQLGRVAAGTALEPEAGARVALPATGLDDVADAMRVTLQGPGIPGERAIHVSGLDAALLTRLGRASGDFPAGFDTWLFTTDGQVAAIPRTTVVQTEGS